MKNIYKKSLAVIALSSLSLMFLMSCAGPKMIEVEDKASDSEQNTEVSKVDKEKEEAEISGDIKIFEPEENETISLPLTVKGEARGTWYFEAYLPLKIVDDQGNELVSSSAQAEGEWMTEDYVPFELTIPLIDFGGAESGKLIFEKANPSGLPENADSYEVPVLFPSEG